MKQLLILFAFCLSQVVFGQQITTLNVIQNELLTYSGKTDSGISFAITLENYNGGNTGNAKLKRISPSGSVLDDVYFPNENPSENFVNQGSFYTSPQNDGYFGYARTWRTNNPIVKFSQSLLFINSDMTFNSSALNLIAYQSSFGQPITVGDKAYVIYSAQQNDAKLIYEDYDDSENLSSLIANPGAGTTDNAWILEIDYGSNVGSLLNAYPIGNSSDNVGPKGYIFDSLILGSDAIYLDNGYVAFKIVKNGDLQFHIMDLNNLSSPVHVFTGLGNEAFITMCNNKYYISKSNINSSGNNGIDVYDSNFNLINQNYELDFPAGRPEYLDCLSSDELLIFINMGSGSRQDHMRRGYFTDEAFDKGFENIPYIDWSYSKAFKINDTKSLHFTAYQGNGLSYGGQTIPPTSGPNDYHMVIWEADISLSPATMTFDDSQSGVLEIFQNMEYDPNDMTQLIDCTPCRKAVITISQSEFNNLPADLGFSNFLVNIINTSAGEAVSTANMGTDLNISDPNLSRYMKAELVLGGPTYALATKGQSYQVYLTPNTFTLGLNEFDNVTYTVYPNPTHDLVTIDTNEHIAKFQIFNNVGQIVLEGNISKDNNINLKQLTSGIYFLMILSENGARQTIKKIIKE